MTIRFKDYRTVENYGKEIYTTNSEEEARQYMKDHDKEMRFLVGGGKTRDRIEWTEIYWAIVTK